MSVELWQIYIDGRKPEKLDGSKNSAIEVYYPANYSLQTVKPPDDHGNNNGWAKELEQTEREAAGGGMKTKNKRTANQPSDRTR
jgi:hypothetical protein